MSVWIPRSGTYTFTMVSFCSQEQVVSCWKGCVGSMEGVPGANARGHSCGPRALGRPGRSGSALICWNVPPDSTQTASALCAHLQIVGLIEAFRTIVIPGDKANASDGRIKVQCHRTRTTCTGPLTFAACFQHVSILISSPSKDVGSLTVAMVASATELALIHGRWQKPRHYAIHAPNQRSNACRTAHSRMKPSAMIDVDH